MRIQDKQHSNKKTILILFGITVLCVFVGVWWYLSTHRSQPSVEIPQSTPEQKTASDAQNGTSQTSNVPAQSTGTTSTKGDSSSPAIDPSVKPATPDGTFVSNHRPNLSGSPAPNTESSVCHTTPGAQCTIVFANGSVTKSLANQTVDSAGNTSWTWSLSSIGITTGEWSITAKAMNGSQVTTTSDPIKLVVNP